jgi:hypothetical protein
MASALMLGKRLQPCRTHLEALVCAACASGFGDAQTPTMFGPIELSLNGDITTAQPEPSTQR